MRVILIEILTLDEYEKVRTHLLTMKWRGIELFYQAHCPHFGFIVMRNKQFISGNLTLATHGLYEDLQIDANRFLKLSEDAVNEILDTKNFIDN